MCLCLDNLFLIRRQFGDIYQYRGTFPLNTMIIFFSISIHGCHILDLSQTSDRLSSHGPCVMK